MRRLAIVLFVAALLFPLSDSMGGGEALDIQAELARPGVKLLVVEFYATTCKPCMEAVPKWKALHEKYKKDGLRFIVVSAEEDKTCSRPPAWSPDKTVCDADWHLMETMGVQKLPASFLYSWEGKLAMKSHQVQPVEDAIRSYFKDTHYKIELDQVKVEGDKYAISGNPNWVQDEVAARIRKLSKFDVVTSSSRFVSQQQADVCDRSFPPNSVMRITLRGYETGERSLTLTLEKDGCTKAGSNQPYGGTGLQEDRESLRRAVRRAVSEVLSQIVRVRSPELVMAESGGEDGDDWFSGAELAILRFESTPKGATVLVDNKPACDATPCSKSFPKGKHRIVMLKEKYLTMDQTLDIGGDKTLQWSLKPDFGWLVIDKVPSGLDVKVDGQVVGTTPLKRQQLSPGRHRVVIASPCCYTKESTQMIIRNKENHWSPKVKLREAGLDVRAVNEKGDEVRAAVYVDDKLIGHAPGRFKVTICAKKLEIIKEGYGRIFRKLNLLEKQMQRIFGTLYSNNIGELNWVYSKPAGVSFTKTEITLGQYKKCVEAGNCDSKHHRTKSEDMLCNWGHNSYGNHPMNCVDWYGAKQFCEWAGGRLPTENEWYAEASNNQSREYPWGDEKVSCSYAVMDDGSDGCGKDRTWPVCSKPSGNSVSGLCDMSGNVWEWMSCKGGSARVLRGGFWGDDNVGGLRASGRIRVNPSDWYNGVGFRCVRGKGIVSPKQNAKEDNTKDEVALVETPEDKDAIVTLFIPPLFKGDFSDRDIKRASKRLLGVLSKQQGYAVYSYKKLEETVGAEIAASIRQCRTQKSCLAKAAKRAGIKVVISGLYAVMRDGHIAAKIVAFDPLDNELWGKSERIYRSTSEAFYVGSIEVLIQETLDTD